ncbi:MAG: hypothetical protein AAGC60_00905 [Acidobacteriota bacterium]
MSTAQPSFRLCAVLGFFALGAALFAFSLAGQSAETPTGQDAPAAVERLDAEALRAMSKEDRRAAIQAHRQARLDAARRAGVDQGPAGYRPLDEPRAIGEPNRPRPKVAGTSIQYDSGTVTGTYTATSLSRMVGNRFDTAAGAPVENSGTITMVTFEMVRNDFYTGVFFTLLSDLVGATARRVTEVLVTGVGAGLHTYTLNSTMTDNQYSNGTFLAGIFQFQVNSTAVGVDTGTTLGQGFHGIEINDNTAMGGGAFGTDFQTIGNRNVVFRVRGNVVTPVELMHFEVKPSTDGD